MRLTTPVRELFQGPNFGHLATLMPDGSPQVTPVWVDTDGEHVLVNTAVGRLKWKNVRRDPRVAIDVTDSANPYRMASVRGRVVALREEGAVAHIHGLARRYTGQERYPLGEGEQRVILVVEPERVATMGF